MTKKKMSLISFVALFLLCGIASLAGAQSFDLRKVADLNTPIPGGSGNFTGFDRPSISGDSVAFAGTGVICQGIFFFNGATLDKVADLNTPIPGGSGGFTGFKSWGVSGGNVAFWGLGVSGQQGIYLFNGHTLIRVADRNTQIPGGSGSFSGFSPPSINGSNVAFRGEVDLRPYGLYLFDGTALTKVADLNTSIPAGLGNFTWFSPPMLSGGNVAFWGEKGYPGNKEFASSMAIR